MGVSVRALSFSTKTYRTFCSVSPKIIRLQTFIFNLMGFTLGFIVVNKIPNYSKEEVN